MDATLDGVSVKYHFWVTLTLTSDLVCRIIMSEHISYILFEIGIPNLEIWCVDASWDFGVSCTMYGSL